MSVNHVFSSGPNEQHEEEIEKESPDKDWMYIPLLIVVIFCLILGLWYFKTKDEQEPEPINTAYTEVNLSEESSCQTKPLIYVEQERTMEICFFETGSEQFVLVTSTEGGRKSTLLYRGVPVPAYEDPATRKKLHTKST